MVGVIAFNIMSYDFELVMSILRPYDKSNILELS